MYKLWSWASEWSPSLLYLLLSPSDQIKMISWERTEMLQEERILNRQDFVFLWANRLEVLKQKQFFFSFLFLIYILRDKQIIPLLTVTLCSKEGNIIISYGNSMFFTPWLPLWEFLCIMCYPFLSLIFKHIEVLERKDNVYKINVH